MYYNNYKLANLTWFKVGGQADIFFYPESLTSLINFLEKDYKSILHSERVVTNPCTKKITVLGAGSNVLISDHGIDGCVIKLGSGFNYIKFDSNKQNLIVGAGTLNYSLAQYCMNNGISGFEFLIGIPGSIGGGVFMNAGSYGTEYKDILDKITCLDYDGKIKHFRIDELNMGYRFSALQDLLKNHIVIEAVFKCHAPDKNLSISIQEKINKIKDHRKNTQPIHEKTCGSTFRNPVDISAWQVIDNLGMRGKKHDGAMVSNLHANFLINHDNASARSLWELGELIRNESKVRMNIDLEWEIKRLGRW